MDKPTERRIRELVIQLRHNQITLPPDFADQLREEVEATHSCLHFRVDVALSNIFDTCRLWIPYVGEDGYAPLVLHSVKRMCRIQTAVLSSHPELGYVGAITPFQKYPDRFLETVAHYKGTYKAIGF